MAGRVERGPVALDKLAIQDDIVTYTTPRPSPLDEHLFVDDIPDYE